tara:strand:- start:268 stop:1248 length:981 start_codon:yes stop_codon:yes gene_type:complete
MIFLILKNNNMKYKKITSIFLTFLLTFISCQNSIKSNLTLLGDQIPTDTPLVFGPRIISTDAAMEFAITFSPEMDEMYFTRRRPKERNNIFVTKLVDGQWAEPDLAFFSSEDTWDFEPHINPKGDVLYFGTNRPLNDTIASSGIHEWHIKKNKNDWSRPKLVAELFKDRFIMFVTSSENGNLYFNSEELGANPDDELSIYYVVNNEGRYTDFIKMGKEINSGTMIAHPFIAPDESYMIFDGIRSSGYGDCDLYISFKENGVWTKSYNLGPEINTEMCEMTASVSPDGKYLFFHRGGGDIGDIYWVDFRLVLERIKKLEEVKYCDEI